MALFELTCVAILVLYVAVRGRAEPSWGAFVGRLAIVSIAGGIGEDLCIRWYGFYSYDERWSLFAGHVPVMVMAIWPFVIHSAWDISRALLGPGHRAVPLLGGAIVWADASLIEPVAVQAGLWSWSEPGLFFVPPIAVLGWAYFAALCMAAWQRGGGGLRDLLVLPVAVTGAHVLLIATWWGALRWVNDTVPPAAGLVVIWILSAAATVQVVRTGAAARVSRRTMWLRVPPALLFGALLLQHARDATGLIAYVAAFVPPYIVLTARGAPAPRAA